MRSLSSPSLSPSLSKSLPLSPTHLPSSLPPLFLPLLLPPSLPPSLSSSPSLPSSSLPPFLSPSLPPSTLLLPIKALFGAVTSFTIAGEKPKGLATFKLGYTPEQVALVKRIMSCDDNHSILSLERGSLRYLFIIGLYSKLWRLLLLLVLIISNLNFLPKFNTNYRN